MLDLDSAFLGKFGGMSPLQKQQSMAALQANMTPLQKQQSMTALQAQMGGLNPLSKQGSTLNFNDTGGGGLGPGAGDNRILALEKSVADLMEQNVFLRGQVEQIHAILQRNGIR